MAFINGKLGASVQAKKLMFGVTEKSRLYLIDGNKYWIPNSLCDFKEQPIPQEDLIKGNGDKPGELIIEDWYYKKHIKK